MRVISTLFFLLVVIIGVTFSLLNADVVVINYYFGEKTLPLSILIILSFAVGGVIGTLFGLVYSFRMFRENSRLKKKVSMSEKEIENLRAIPLKDSH